MATITNKPKVEEAVRFWEEVNELFPYEGIDRWIEAIEKGEADWWRNGSLAWVAVQENSRGGFGFSNVKFDENNKKVEEIYSRYNLHLQP